MKKFILIFTIVLLNLNLVDAKTLDNVYKVIPNLECELNISSKDNIRLMQGVVFFKRDNVNYAVYAGTTDDANPKVITLVNLDNCTVVDKNSEKVLGHANDLTYNTKTEEFYVTTVPLKINKKYYIDRFIIDDNNKITFIENGTITTDTGITSGFGYDASRNSIVVQQSSTLSRLKLNDNNFEIINVITKELSTYYEHIIFANRLEDDPVGELYYVNSVDDESGYAKFVNQGIDYYNNNIYSSRALNGTKQESEPVDQRRINSAYTLTPDGEVYGYDVDSGYILVYDAMNGKYKYSIYVPNYIFKGHLEGITVTDNKIFLGYNIHSTSPKKVSFLTINNVDDFEIKYHIKEYYNDHIVLNDVIALLRGYLDIDEINSDSEKKFDLNNNGVIELKDVINLLKNYLN